MDIYTDYGNWKFENYDFINSLVKNQSKSIARFTHVIAVVDFLYEKRLSIKKALDDLEEVIFESGFNYIHDHFLTLQTLCEKTFDNNIFEMEKFSKTINLLLFVNDFQNELLTATDDIKTDMKILDDFETKILELLESKTNALDTMFPLLDDITIPMFDRHNINLYTTEQIFYDIAVEYGIYKDDDDDDAFEVFNKVKAI